MGKTNTPEFMNVREVARYLGINEKKIYFLANTKKIPCTRVTGKWTFPKQLIDRWIDESASGSVGRFPARQTTRSCWRREAMTRRWRFHGIYARKKGRRRYSWRLSAAARGWIRCGAE